MSCAGSIMMCPPPVKSRDQARPKDELLVQAKDFIDQYYTSIKRLLSYPGVINIVTVKINLYWFNLNAQFKTDSSVAVHFFKLQFLSYSSLIMWML